MPIFGTLPALLLLTCCNVVFAQSVDGIRLGMTPDHTRVVLDLSQPLQVYRVLEQPGSLLVEIEGFDLGIDPAGLALAGTPITAVQHSQTDHTLRLVLVLNRALGSKSFTLKPYQTRGHRLVIDLGDAEARRDAGLPASPPENAKIAAAPVPVQQRASPKAVSAETPSPAPQAPSTEVNFDGTWKQEWAVETDGSDSQKFEALVEPRVDVRFPNKTRLTAIGRIRLDSVGDLGPDVHKAENYSSINGPWYNSAHAEFSLRELYLDLTWGRSYWRLGKQQVVWGEADGIKVLDVVNPQSFREFILDDFDDSRIPLTMVNVELPVGEDTTLQLLWIPDTTFHELAEPGTPFFLTSPNLVPNPPKGIDVSPEEPDKPDDLLGDSDVGGRLSAFVAGWDITLNYLYHFQDFPALYQDLALSDESVVSVISLEYERNHLAGGTFSNAFGDLTLRGELAYSTDTFHVSSDRNKRFIEDSAELATVLGLDWQLVDYNSLLSFQWFQSHLFDYGSAIGRDETEHNLSLFYQRDFANETWQFDSLLLYSANNEDWLLQLQLKYLWMSNLEVWLGADIFSGDREGLYGQFRDRDRLLFGMKLGF
jgi:hypothetical protein